MVMSTKEHSLLVEKYRSKDLTEYVGNEHIKTQIQKYLDQDDIQNFIFYGPAGTGKTTLAKLIVNNLECDYLYINASDERGIETIRDKVTSFSSTISFKALTGNAAVDTILITHASGKYKELCQGMAELMNSNGLVVVYDEDNGIQHKLLKDLGVAITEIEVTLDS